MTLLQEIASHLLKAGANAATSKSDSLVDANELAALPGRLPGSCAHTPVPLAQALLVKSSAGICAI